MAKPTYLSQNGIWVFNHPGGKNAPECVRGPAKYVRNSPHVIDTSIDIVVFAELN